MNPIKQTIHIAKPSRSNGPAKRDPATTQAWLIGGGIASLSAAVHLIHDANVTPTHIHILDEHAKAGGGIKSCGNADDGYVLYTGSLPYFHDRCVEELLALVPSVENPEQSLLDTIKDSDQKGAHKQKSTTRLICQGKDGPECVHITSLQIGPKYRMELMRIMLENERALGDGCIKDYFDEAFFKTNFWIQWSTTFALQPWHSVAEFRRCLCKHLADIEHLNDVKPLDRTKYAVYESIILPIKNYLERLGVNFHFHTQVTKLQTNPGSPQTITQILLTDTDTETSPADPATPNPIEVSPTDLVLVTLGSTNSGTQTGTNTTPPPSPPADFLTSPLSSWTLWTTLTSPSPSPTIYGTPTPFHTHIPETTLCTFTTTLKSTDFLTRYSTLTSSNPGTGALLTLASSPWLLSISVPAQPICPNQHPATDIIWGYGLHPFEPGTFVRKPMTECTGQEIASELLQHLNFPVADLLPHSITIPCVMPLATAPMLPRKPGQRPDVVAGRPGSGNLGLVGQFVELPDDTTLSMEYSVRGARVAVDSLMGVGGQPPKIERHLLLSVFDLLGGA
ncbi:67 kDa myosin-cross-reactive antigen like protein [Aspergillus ellipticus CBS 707.79]|uniref:67 kDa myosin-cross-reactive antigen like protein n=1 Tax=Aspergillus ellipticus CBS 707.79 TaxID=1448320 RepID=A0A319CT94_9EURO|nr:67 kDa myosin-cross-reactive antigen like protein [Aspergillus ellipticus CBS 707.79]